jgi:DMSO reductase family type II enzyme chaperone
LETELALCRSALWEALALGLRPPDAETVARLASPDGGLALADAAAVLDAARGTGLAAAARRLGRTASVDALAATYTRLFGHTARGPVPPYETEYGADSVFQPMHEMSDLVAFYRAFGLQLRPTAHERPDHVSCESEFLAFLARKEAYALAHGDAAMREATRAAERRFLGDHLGRWGLAFARLLERHDPGGFYGALGTLGAELIAAECARVGVVAGPELSRLRAASPPAVPAACAPETDAEGPEGASAMGRLGRAGATWPS